MRIRDEAASDVKAQHRKSQDIAKFSRESLHSFSFSTAEPAMNETRKSIIQRSIGYMMSKFGWSTTDDAAYETFKASVMEKYGYPVRRGSTAFFSHDDLDVHFQSPNADSKQRPGILQRAYTEYPSLDKLHISSTAEPAGPPKLLTSNSASHLPGLSMAAPQQHGNIHSPTRFLPQNQAIITTSADNRWRIILANDISSLIFGYDRGQLQQMSALDLIGKEFAKRQEQLLSQRRVELGKDQCHSTEQRDDKGIVLVCGKVIPIIKKNGFRSACSLWLKEKRDDTGNPIYIWIFEEIAESLVSVFVNDAGIIQDVVGSIHELYGYRRHDVVGKNVRKLVPVWQKMESHDSGYAENVSEISEKLMNFDQINNIKFFGSISKYGVCFPIITKARQIPESYKDKVPNATNIIKIISLPTIAGLVTLHADGMIQSCNQVFAKYLFGYTTEQLVERRKIDDLLPQFPALITHLGTDERFKLGNIISYMSCRRILQDVQTTEDVPVFSYRSPISSPKPGSGKPGSRRPSTVSRRASIGSMGQPLPPIVAVHRDGAFFEVHLQMRLVDSSEESLIALWITFDRAKVFSKHGHTAGVEHDKTTSGDLSPLFEGQLLDLPETPDDKPKIPMAAPKPMHITKSPKGVDPTNIIAMTPPISETPPPSMCKYSALDSTSKQCIDDFVIVHSLGQGAYGHVNLAYNKATPNKKVVLKYVIKDKILSDCWMNDKQLGLIPIEIHVLHTLRRIPHDNICNMTDFFEDTKNYYIEMGLHGEGMDLFDYIELNENMTRAEIQHIFRQIVDAVAHLHRHNIVHRDIKDENVIVDSTGHVQLIDFGSAAYLKPEQKFDTFAGTLDYCAPEVLRGNTYTGPPQDIWSLGILLYTLIYKENPFYNIDEIMSRDLRIPYTLDDGSIDLIKHMLDRDVDSRLTIEDVVQHRWLTAIE
ncbi:unnamed protein product [Umbelopsis ramanniana]